MKASSSSTTTIIDDHWHIIIIIIIVYAVPALLHALQSATAADATFLLLPDHTLKHVDLQQQLSKTKSRKFIRLLYTHSQATIVIPTTTTTTTPTQISSAIP
jgi:hypothetical protein